MEEVLVLGDGTKAPPDADRYKSVVRLKTWGANPNIRFQVDVFRAKFLQEIPERLDDLVRLAAFIYAADTRVSRGGDKDVFGRSWSRAFRMVVPVWDVGFWQSEPIGDLLRETLGFLTGDTYSFEFVQRLSGTPFQSFLQFKEFVEPLPGIDTVVLFSGGVDSLAATLQSIREARHPILVSHRSAPVIDNRQRNLVSLLRMRFPDWQFPHISMWVNRTGGKRTVEFSQRSRSFLFTTLGVVAAAMLNVDEVRLCDNGIVSINLPQSGQNVGTFLSRSTHPRFLAQAQDCMRVVTGRPQLTIRNTLLFMTKKEVVEIIAASGHPQLLQETMSCAHTEGKTRIQPHCGVCPQCVDRRFATVAAGLQEHDLATRYERDVFLDPLDDGADRTHVENYVRLAARLESIQSPDELFAAFSELYDGLPIEGDAEVFGRQLWELFKRHADVVNRVLDDQVGRHSPAIRQGSLPANCLLRIAVSGQLVLDPKIRYVERLRSLICQSLPAAFRTVEAENERHVQDVGESVFLAAREKLDRESPQVPFGVVTTKPDFSAGHDVPPLFVEFKYPQSRSRLNSVVTEMTSRVTIYEAQGAWILFVVYDPRRTIGDDDKFVNALARHNTVWVGISR